MPNFEIFHDLSKTDSPWQIPEHLKDTLPELYTKVLKGKPSAKNKLFKLIKQYPEMPVFRNYLAVWYERNDMLEKAQQENRTTNKLFPSYIFARINLITELIHSEHVNEAGNMLGKELSITSFCPGRQKFHLSEFKNYTSAVIKYLAATQCYQQAEERVRELERYGVPQEDIDSLRDFIDFYRMGERAKQLQDLKERFPDTIERENPTFCQRDVFMEAEDETYAFLYSEVLWQIDPQELQKNIVYNKEGLIKEAKRILQIAIEGYEYCEATEEWDAAVLHALLILSHTDPGNSLPFVLNLLRQPSRCIYFWLGDWGDDALQTFFNKGTSDMLNLVKNIILERYVSESAKNMLLELMPLFVLNQPELKPEFVNIIKEIMDYYEIHQDDTSLFNPVVLSFAIGAAVDIEVTELLDDIRQLYKKELVDPTIEGPIEEVEENLFTGKLRRNWTKYNDLIGHVKALSDQSKRLYSTEKTNDDDDPLPMDLEEENEGLSKPETSIYEKVALNALCPCGSGKKFKRCHGKKGRIKSEVI